MPEARVVHAPVIYFSDDHCVVGKKKLSNVGVLLDGNSKPVTVVTDYLVYRRMSNKGRPDTIKLEGWILRLYWEFMSRERANFIDVTDEFLIRWSNCMQKGIRVNHNQKPDPSKKGKNNVLPIENTTINQRISVVVAFYVWCKEVRKIPSYVVGDPSIVDDAVYQITVKRNAKTGEFCWPYYLKDTRSPRKPTPTDNDVKRLRDQIEKNHGDDVSIRNNLIVSWKENVGLREVEVTSLRTDQIPSQKEITELMEKEVRHQIVLSERLGNKTKGGYTRELYVDPLLLQDTRDYIDLIRDEIVERFKRKGNYKEPPQIFLSVINGKSIKAKTLANELGKAFKDASVPGSPHRLRSKFTFDTVERLYIGMLLEKGDHRKIDANTIIFMAKEALGIKHASTMLRHYLDLVKLKILAMSKAQRFAYAEQRATIASKMLDEKQKKLSETQEKLSFHKELSVAIQQGDKDLVFILVQKIRD